MLQTRFLIKFFGGRRDGETRLVKVPLPREYALPEGTYLRDRTNDRKHVKAYTIKPKSTSTTK